MSDELTFTTVVLTNIGSPNANGRVYTQEIVEQIQATLKEPGRNMVSKNAPTVDGVDLDKVVGVVESTEIINNQLVATIKLLNTPYKQMMHDLMDLDEVSFRTAGYARQESGGTIKDYNFTCIYMCPKQED